MKKNYIPTIDVSPILKSNFEGPKCFDVIKKIEKTCVDVGFFQITGHGIRHCCVTTFWPGVRLFDFSRCPCRDRHDHAAGTPEPPGRRTGPGK